MLRTMLSNIKPILNTIDEAEEAYKEAETEEQTEKKHKGKK